MTEHERIDYLIKTLEGNNAKSFANKTGINPASVSKIRKGSYHIGRYLDRICSAYSQVNKEWLITGIGDSGVEVRRKTSEEYEKEIERLNGVIDVLTRQIKANLRIIDRLERNARS